MVQGHSKDKKLDNLRYLLAEWLPDLAQEDEKGITYESMVPPGSRLLSAEGVYIPSGVDEKGQVEVIKYTRKDLEALL